MGTYRKILLATDFSEQARKVAAEAVRLARRHEALRTTLEADAQGRTWQRVHPFSAVPLPLVDLSGLPAPGDPGEETPLDLRPPRRT